MKQLISLPIAILILCISCKNKNDKINNTLNKSTSIKDERLSNTNDAKPPKGKMSFVINGKVTTVNESSVQCMYIGMGSNMAQSVISGGSQVSIMHIAYQKLEQLK